MPILIGFMSIAFATYLMLKGIKKIVKIDFPTALAIGTAIGIMIYFIVKPMIAKVAKAIESGEATQDEIMVAMDIMQYQDIHRQKIERVINIMRALIRYMNKLFEGKVSDEERVKSATYIPGDNKEVVSDEEIEELLKQFGA